MALANGVLVHGPTSWAAAVRTEGGEIEVASGRKRLLPWNGQVVRGPARLLEALLVLPRVRRSLRRRALRSSARRFSRRWRPRESAAEPSRDPPASGIAGAGGRNWRWHRRCSRRERDLAAYHGAEHVSIGTYEHGERAAKEHERCGTHLVGPLLLATAAGATLAGKARVGPQSRPVSPLGRWPPRPRSSAGWCATPSIRSPGRCHGPARSSRSESPRRAVAGAGGGRRRGPPRLPRARAQLGGSGGTVLVAGALEVVMQAQSPHWLRADPQPST